MNFVSPHRLYASFETTRGGAQSRWIAIYHPEQLKTERKAEDSWGFVVFSGYLFVRIIPVKRIICKIHSIRAHHAIYC
jgi:hypothetical protein